ncbi:MAG TPA: class I SAM-dependent methyltransferase [Propionibacteriaceae bacterium]|jgi:SAM-dependent methyltransferase|nr:class I SAM-dependent methyltransferase [Propionibacteriaceae bacterium]
MSTGRAPYPDAAAAWMVAEEHQRVLDLGSGTGGFAAMLHRAGHEVFCLDRAVDRVAGLPDRLGTRLHVAGQVESLPFLSCNFDVVTAAATLHRFAPGLALTEIARVLRPGGQLAVAYNTRDDTVPWVRRLSEILQQADPDAMRGDFGVDSIHQLSESPYFLRLERRNFRNWVPITRPQLLAMVERRPAVRALEPWRRDGLLAEVGQLYDSSARAPDPLLLPFQASCWRAEVDHSRMAIDDDWDDVLQIAL